ncbi:MAG: guanylate kinase [Rhizobiaceae bacterium]|nr:guanylate kinase [Hyphomicrobiales bacterium]NRB30139.1 guanylate kinase [Rhizobiaceae bacterium]
MGNIDKEMSRRGLMLVLSSPSGAGKSTIARNLLRDDPDISLSVSVTTRARRGSEIDGKDYHFISEREFEIMRDNGRLLEWAEVHGNYYGTPFDPVQQAMDEGRDMLFDIDWQGALQMFEAARADIVSIFILPPSMAELRNRLIRRAEDAEDVIERRLENSKVEMQHWNEYEYPLINDDLDACFADVKAILRAERLRRDRRSVGMSGFVGGLLK